MPARRKRKKKTKKIKPKNLIRFIVFIITVVLVSIFFFSKAVWSGKAKLSIVVGGDFTDVYVYVLDLSNDSIGTVVIPSKTWVDSSRQLGTWKLGNLWRVGENEKMGGRLIAETVTKNFEVPVYAWLKIEDEDFVNKNYLSRLGILFCSGETNLSIKDMVRVAAFFSFAKIHSEPIELLKSGILVESDREDGSFEIESDMPQRVKALSAQSEFLKGNVKVSLINVSGGTVDMSTVTSIVESMGAKVAFVKNDEEENSDCEVYGDRNLTYSIEKAFACENVSESTEGNFDIEIRLGKKFGERF